MKSWIDTLLAKSSPIGALLYLYMSAISEGLWCAGWEHGTEYACWDARQGRPTEWGGGCIGPEQVATLRRLSSRAGGWWHWPDGAIEPEFVTLKRWKQMYAEHASEHSPA